MEKQGIIEKVDHSDWAAPIVAVPKKDGRFRICGDYKVTVNPVLEVNQYPLPKLDDLFATLSKGVVFSKLDLSQAYLHYQLYEDVFKVWHLPLIKASTGTQGYLLELHQPQHYSRNSWTHFYEEFPELSAILMTF